MCLHLYKLKLKNSEDGQFLILRYSVWGFNLRTLVVIVVVVVVVVVAAAADVVTVVVVSVFVVANTGVSGKAVMLVAMAMVLKDN